MVFCHERAHAIFKNIPIDLIALAQAKNWEMFSEQISYLKHHFATSRDKAQHL